MISDEHDCQIILHIKIYQKQTVSYMKLKDAVYQNNNSLVRVKLPMINLPANREWMGVVKLGSNI